MDSPSSIRHSAGPEAAGSTPRGWKGSLFLGLALVAIYAANGRDMATTDTAPATVLPLMILRGQGIYLDKQSPPAQDRHLGLAFSVVRRNNHVISRYPIAPALVVLPLYVPQIAFLDWCYPGWDRDPFLAETQCKVLAKRSLTILMALAGVMLYRYLIAIGLGPVAWPAAVAASLGSSLWTIGSMAMWQHGPAAFCLIATIVLLDPAPVSRTRLLLASFPAALLFACRLTDVLFTVAFALWVATTRRRGLRWFLPIVIAGAFILAAYNLLFFDSITGGQRELEALHPHLHGVSGTLSGNLIEGAAGTLLSPSRGLFVFSPWIALALAALCIPEVRHSLSAHRLLAWLSLMLIPYFIVFSKYSVWWGGHCFGPRYWTDAIPLFAIIFAFALDWMRRRARILLAVAAVAIAYSIAIQSIGAFCYPSTWNQQPVNVDLHHERLWDWRDTEITRCLSEFSSRIKQLFKAGS